MNRSEAWLSHLALVAVGVSGIVYAVMKYWMTPVGEFAVIGHPWQPFFLDAHVLTAPVFVFSLGVLYHAHWLPMLRNRRPSARRTGLAILWVAAPMAFSGYLIQVTTGETARQVMIAVHLATGAAYLAAYLAHQLLPKPARSVSTIEEGEELPSEIAGELPLS